MSRSLQYMLIASTLTLLTIGFAQARTLHVNCDKNQSLSFAVSKARSGSVIMVSGVCRENVYIDQDGITLDGMGTAVLDGSHGQDNLEGVLIIDQARKTMVRNLSVVNGKHHGIVVRRGSVADLHNITVADHAQNGVFVMQNSQAGLENVHSRDNGNYGIGIIQNSSATFVGLIQATGNANSGILLADNAMADASKADIESKSNLNGIQFGDHAVLFTTATTRIFANENLRDGLFLFNSGTLESAGGGYIEAKNNQASGARLIGNATLSNPMGAGRYVFEDNPQGIHFDVQSSGFFVGGLSVRNNLSGIYASGAHTLTVISLPDNPSVVENNQAVDADLSFGTRADFQGLSILKIQCDATVLIRGNVTCP